MFCYDIREPKRLSKTARFLENYGIRIQYSFFQSEISKENLKFIVDGVRNIIDEEEDSFFIYPLCNKCTKKAEFDGEGSLIKLDYFEIL